MKLSKVQFGSMIFWSKRNMWNETETFRPEFGRKIRNGSRFKIRWNLFRFVLFFELVWNVSTIPGETERNWQPCYVHHHIVVVLQNRFIDEEDIVRIRSIKWDGNWFEIRASLSYELFVPRIFKRDYNGNYGQILYNLYPNQTCNPFVPPSISIHSMC